MEHLWDELGRRVLHRQNPPETPHVLSDAHVVCARVQQHTTNIYPMNE